MSRRALLRGLGVVSAAAALSPLRRLAAAAAGAAPLLEVIPHSGERLPAIGMGSWLTFDVPPLAMFRDPRVEVVRELFARGGAVIDSSPMYGQSEAVIGYALRQLHHPGALFAATKVWTPLQWLGRRQIEESFRLWGVERFALLQIHNMLSWESHLETLRELRAAQRIRYIGITTSHGRRHEELAQVMRTQPFDFVQLSYNLLDREAEARLLPLAQERGIAVIVNRPFRTGELIEILGPHPLPPWAGEIGCRSWPQLLLKFVVSHPGVTCAIPATSRLAHMAENMGALYGPQPDAAQRQRLVRYVEAL